MYFDRKEIIVFMSTSERRKRIDEKIHRSCPKCGNNEGVLVLPGMGLTFYYCPKCDDKTDNDEKIEQRRSEK